MALLTRGNASDEGRWTQLFWLLHTKTCAVRRSRADNCWYITRGLSDAVVIVHGPYESLDTVEMLLTMAALELPEIKGEPL